MTENETGEIVVDCAVKMHMRLGPGLLESVYATVLCYELHNKGRSIQQLVAVPISYHAVNRGFSSRSYRRWQGYSGV